MAIEFTKLLHSKESTKFTQIEFFGLKLSGNPAHKSNQAMQGVAHPFNILSHGPSFLPRAEKYDFFPPRLFKDFEKCDRMSLRKNRPKCSPNHGLSKLTNDFYR
jgi:hypothetical protein